MRISRNPLLTLLIVVVFLCFSVTSQDTLTDPLNNFDLFYENSLSLNATRINTNNTEFNTSSGDFHFKKNNFRPSIDFTVNVGWLLNNENASSIKSIKTGLNFTTRSADLHDQNNNELRLSTNYLMIPVQFGYRYPLRFRTVKNNLFRAIEYNIGMYASSPYYQKLDHPDNIDSPGTFSWFNYLRLGFITEVSFTAINEEGRGHHFGIRVSSEYSGIIKFSETENELYPEYVNIGLFYKLNSAYFKRKK